jgi:hypothetical protein
LDRTADAADLNETAASRRPVYRAFFGGLSDRSTAGQRPINDRSTTDQRPINDRSTTDQPLVADRSAGGFADEFADDARPQRVIGL